MLQTIAHMSLHQGNVVRAIVNRGIDRSNEDDFGPFHGLLVATQNRSRNSTFGVAFQVIRGLDFVIANVSARPQTPFAMSVENSFLLQLPDFLFEFLCLAVRASR